MSIYSEVLIMRGAEQCTTVHADWSRRSHCHILPRNLAHFSSGFNISTSMTNCWCCVHHNICHAKIFEIHMFLSINIPDLYVNISKGNNKRNKTKTKQHTFKKL